MHKEAGEAIKQAGEAKERAAIMESNNLAPRSNVVALEFVLMQTSSNLVRIDPQNLPITSIRANALMFVRETNVWKNIDPVKDNHFATLSIGNRNWVQTNNVFKLRLVCKSFEKLGPPDSRE